MGNGKANLEAEWCSLECPFCGKKHGAYMEHYQLLKASCGRIFWALRPKRNGPLALYLHPGFSRPVLWV